MLMLILAILASLISIVLCGFIMFANGMSDSPGSHFQGGWVMVAVWVVTIALYLAWWLG